MKSGCWENSLRYSDPDAIQIILQIPKAKGADCPSPEGLVAFGIYSFMACVYNLEGTQLEVVTSFSVNRSWRSMKVTFLSDPEKQCLWFCLSIVPLQLVWIREPCGTHCPDTGLLAALVLTVQPSTFSCPPLDPLFVELTLRQRHINQALQSCCAILNMECGFGMTLKQLWKHTHFLKGERLKGVFQGSV